MQSCGMSHSSAALWVGRFNIVSFSRRASVREKSYPSCTCFMAAEQIFILGRTILTLPGLREDGLVLVMPEGDSSYYVNSAEHLHDRYEDYIVNDVIADSQSKFPIAAGPEHRAIVGISMGGFGAVNLSLRHPDLFAFVGPLSPAVDVPSRPFSIKRIGQWREHSSIFGPWGSETRRANDPYLLVPSVDPAVTPYFYVSCGEQEGLLPANRKLARLFADHGFRFEFHAGPGGHNWNQWNARLPDVFHSLSEHIQQTR